MTTIRWKSWSSCQSFLKWQEIQFTIPNKAFGLFFDYADRVIRINGCSCAVMCHCRICGRLSHWRNKKKLISSPPLPWHQVDDSLLDWIFSLILMTWSSPSISAPSSALPPRLGAGQLSVRVSIQINNPGLYSVAEEKEKMELVIYLVWYGGRSKEFVGRPKIKWSRCFSLHEALSWLNC